MSVRRVLGLFLLLGSFAVPMFGQDNAEPAEVAVRQMAGRVPWGVTALPSGYLVVPCEDKSVTIVKDGRVVAAWQAPDRFSAAATVSPGSQPRIALPQITGRIDVCAWDTVTQALAVETTLTHQAEATATAWGPGKTLAAAWKDGHVELWASGHLRWTGEAGFPAAWLLFVPGQGIYVVGRDQVILFDEAGRLGRRWTVAGTPRGVLATLGGTLFVWGSSGLWARSPEDPAFVSLDSTSDLLGVVTDRRGSLVVTGVKRISRLSPSGTLLSTFALPRSAVSATVVDDRGRLVVGTAGGVEVWTYDGRLLGILDPVPPASDLLITDEGLGTWGDIRWALHIWKGFRWPPFSWPVAGGGSGRSYSTAGNATVAARAADWLEDNQFRYLYSLVASGEEAKQSQVLDLLESKAAAGSLRENLPFANILLLKTVRSGITDLMLSQNRVTNNWPALRLRALRLLGRSAQLEDRGELLDLLGKEFDPAVAAEEVRALAQSGWDGDGKVLGALQQLLNRMPDQPQVAQAILEGAMALWKINGASTDAGIVPLVQRLYQGPYPRATKLLAQRFFQELAQGP